MRASGVNTLICRATAARSGASRASCPGWRFRTASYRASSARLVSADRRRSAFSARAARAAAPSGPPDTCPSAGSDEEHAAVSRPAVAAPAAKRACLRVVPVRPTRLSSGS
ncbi:hypothetical protein ACFXP3_21300 [Streptomyces sp. NPDC059096]|uniref:hypothetical protein n=1 Tax=Streptomyces sp. NPDC059096 TaxID=3346727 RepID=UPI0036998F6C